AGNGTLLYLVFDFNDAYKAHLLPGLQREFAVAPIDEYRGTFADYPVGAFNVFHGPRVRVYQLREK
ncbi:MAG TPA: hypothetical protein VFJ90_08655, partial [Candidatus Didemnitutus sp.]|nr:hypothetical protein [Candidatus Didemnitutus sp.]